MIGDAGIRFDQVRVGDALPEFVLPVTAAVVVSGAIASRDFMPVHHDRDYAQSQGAPDIFMNILTSNGYVARYATDWAGPTSRIRKIAVRLGAPAIPGQPLRFTGEVSKLGDEAERRTIELTIRAANALGDHLSGTVELDVPRD